MIKISEDMKTRCYKGQKNALGLMPGPKWTCPNATTGEGGCWNVREGRKLETCYVTHCLARRPNVTAALTHNTELIYSVKGKNQVDLLAEAFHAFQTKELKRDDPQLYFRLHWSGDIYDSEYASSLSKAIDQFPQIKFWMYTRSFQYINVFRKLRNLSLYLSLDRQNFTEGLKTYNMYKWPHLKICYLSPEDDWQKQFQKMKDEVSEDIKPVGCPADIGKIGLEESCAKCRICLRNGRKTHVWFKTK